MPFYFCVGSAPNAAMLYFPLKCAQLACVRDQIVWAVRGTLEDLSHGPNRVYLTMFAAPLVELLLATGVLVAWSLSGPARRQSIEIASIYTFVALGVLGLVVSFGDVFISATSLFVCALGAYFSARRRGRSAS